MTRLARALVRVAGAVWAWLCRAGDRWDAAVAEALAVADETPSEVACPPRLTVAPIIGKTGRGVRCHDCCLWLLDSQTSDDPAEQAAKVLADRAHQALSAGITGADVEAAWERVCVG